LLLSITDTEVPDEENLFEVGGSALPSALFSDGSPNISPQVSPKKTPLTSPEKTSAENSPTKVNSGRIFLITYLNFVLNCVPI
jgi:hypothetical protein